MSIDLYDEAVLEKIKKWVLDPKMRILKPDETQRLFEMTLDQTKDEPLTLPLIAISRHRNIEIKNTQKQPKTFTGIQVYKSDDQSQSIPLNAIPIKLGYQIDIYTRFLKESCEYLRNFVFNFINHPKLFITLPYNGIDYIHKSIINLDPTLNDNSDIKEHLFSDQFTRFTLNIYIEDAYLFNAPMITNSRLTDIEVWVHEKNTDRTSDYLVASTDDNP